ncbi:hypothetical protein RUM43_003181 [Polyplax serrata]|uniref:Anion exchange protein n=1 Tax=Polyplax serrata TaxID=468196 RepID=A0AAN8S6E1_POLSC
MATLSSLNSNRPKNILSDSHGIEAGPDLDQEMEKVFSMDGEKFDLSKISTSPDSVSISKRQGGEIDLNLHRKKSYPHVYPPLKSLHFRGSKRLTSPRPSESESADGGSDANTSRKNSKTGMESDACQSPTEIPKIIFSDEDRDDRTGSDNEAPLSERAAAPHHDVVTTSSDALRRVQFQIGEIPEDQQISTGDDGTEARKVSGERRNSRDKRMTGDMESGEPEKRRRKHRHHHHHHHSRYRKYSLQDDLVARTRAGSDISPSEISRKNSIQPEEASLLDEVDVENLESRRFDDLRRYKVPLKNSSLSVIRIGRKDGDKMENVVPLGSDKKMIDHSPHEVFVQLDELCGVGEEREWKETARWIKYEEDVEEGADRWGQPHVASLSFHSLLNLRRCLETGVVLLDLEEKDLPGVAYRVVEQMVIEEFIDESDKATVMRALLLRHRHVNEHDRFRFAMKRNFSSYTSLQNLTHDAKPKIVPSLASMDHFSPKGGLSIKVDEKAANGDSHHHTIDIKEELTYTSSSEDLRRAAKESILRKIPIGAEATTVLVGAVDFLDQPTIAFARLAEGILMPSITEVAIPVRFLFLLLGPPQSDLDYHEIGRSISTLMANDQFHNIAYKATGRKELLSAINEFLDDSIVLPPGDWERKALLPFSELKAKSEAIRKRKNRRLKEAEAEGGNQQKALLISEDGKKPPFDDPLKRTKRPFGGMIRDVRRRFPHYKSDIIDGLNLQCLAAAIFMYFAALSGAITFGGLMGDKTHNLIGISETLVATCICGILFALLSGQPLVIVGTTGPLLLFDESLFSFCEANGIDYLGIRVYIGIWLGIIGLIVVCFEGSVFVKMFTRFTEEIFAALISLLYIVESLVKLFSLYVSHPLLSLPEYCSELTPHNFSQQYVYDNDVLFSNNSDGNVTGESNVTNNEIRRMSILLKEEGPINQPNTALFCTILALGTFFIAYYLRQFRNSKFLGRSARRALGDFGVPIAIVVMVVLDYFVPSTYTEKLQVPEGLEPSKSEVRGWVISPLGVQIWIAFAAVGPALLVYILLFMETHITELIIDKKDRKLKKGSGFHLDIVILCVLNIGCGFMGAPWMCAATVRSIAHVSAVTVMSRTHAPGDKPHIIDVKEQRMSSLFVAILVGISVLMAPLLRLVPMAVLFGVFLYMGVSSTNGIQFFDRLKLFFMPVKHHSQASYVRRVQTMKMHLFTLIQLLCLVMLWVVKSTPISLAFPFFLILMVPLRAQLKCLFTPAELRALDSEELDGDPDSPEDEPDFYTEAPLPG